MEKGRQAQGILVLAECTGLSPVANSFVCWRLSWISRVRREWECPTLPSLALVPPERLSVSCEHDTASCCLSWLRPALWFQFLVSIFRCVGSFPSSERDCFSDLNYHPQNLGKKGLCAIACFFKITYVFLTLHSWWHQIAAEVTTWESATVTTTNHFILWMETCDCTKRNQEKKTAYVWRSWNKGLRADDYFSISHKGW